MGRVGELLKGAHGLFDYVWARRASLGRAIWATRIVSSTFHVQQIIL